MSACLGCGYCCMKAPCALAHSTSDTPVTAPCPYLVHREGKYRCSIILSNPSEEMKAAVGGIGSGCCSPLFNTYRERMEMNERRLIQPMEFQIGQTHVFHIDGDVVPPGEFVPIDCQSRNVLFDILIRKGLGFSFSKEYVTIDGSPFRYEASGGIDLVQVLAHPKLPPARLRRGATMVVYQSDRGTFIPHATWSMPEGATMLVVGVMTDFR